MRDNKRALILLVPLGWAVALCTSMMVCGPSIARAMDYPAAPAPTPDPLAVPVLPASPTQVDIGRNLYFYHCMPCHGDQGQGLTDAWREVWPEDHRNCWGRGCHAGRADDEGFPIPRFVPAVIGSPQALAHFEAPEQLADYLVQAHPPQRPGALSATDCQAVTAFLWYENDRPTPGGQPGPALAARRTQWVGVSVAAILGILLTARSFAHPANA